MSVITTGRFHFYHSDGRLHLLADSDTEGNYRLESVISEGDIETSVKNYWDFVNETMLTEWNTLFNKDDRRTIIDEMIIKGGAIADNLLGKHISDLIQRFTLTHNRLLIITDFFNIPWESLHFGDDEKGFFLAERCQVVRRLAKRSVGLKKPGKRNGQIFSHKDILLLGSSIIDEKIGVDKLCEILKDLDSGDDASGSSRDTSLASLENRFIAQEVKICSTLRDFTSKAKGADLVHLVCKNGSKGISFSDRANYSLDAAKRFVLRNVNLLVINTCKGGVEVGQLNIPAMINSYSGCTVIAPGFFVPLDAAYYIAVVLDKLAGELRANGGEITAADFWNLVCDRGDPDALLKGLETSGMRLITLWYGMYGDPDRRLI